MKNFENPFDSEKFTADIAERTAEKVSEKLVLKRWMKLKLAMHYSSLSRARLLKLVKTGLIAGTQDPDSKRGDWIIDKRSIDEYMTALVVSTRHKAKAIIASLKTA